MTQSLQFRLKAGQRIYVNGAVLRVDRKVAVEFLNDVTFMLDSHVLQVEDATTPLKQLYYSVQMVLMDPTTADAMRDVLHRMVEDAIRAFQNKTVIDELDKIRDLLARERFFECLKVLRGLFPLEAEIMRGEVTSEDAEDADVVPQHAATGTEGRAAWK
jgi:flagellar protein FlbT